MALHEVKLCLLGESGVGKTCIVNRFVSDTFSEHESLTVGAAFTTKTVKVGDNSVLFQIWDTAGQEKYRGLAPMYYRGSAAAIVCYDITSERSFNDMQTWITELRQLGPQNLILAIAGNKVDLEPNRRVATSTGATFAKNSHAIFLETSAKDNINVHELFRTIGAPGNVLKVPEIISKACEEADIYRRCGLHGVMVENMHDVPYMRGVAGPEVTACMARIACEVRRVIGDAMTLGVQILSCGNREALAVANASDADFVRVEGFVFSHVGDEGWTDSCAGELLRYRKNIGAQHISVWTDIKKKHCSHQLTADLRIQDVAKAAYFFCSDGVVITGQETAQPVNQSDLEAVRKVTKLPIIVGSGVNEENLGGYCGKVDGMIVGSHFKTNGHWENNVDESRVRTFMDRQKSYDFL